MKFWIHAKHIERLGIDELPDDSEWLRQRVLPVSHHPEWGSVELVRAAIDLLQTSFDDSERVEWFCLASESCLPVQPLAKVCSRAAGESVYVFVCSCACVSPPDSYMWLL